MNNASRQEVTKSKVTVDRVYTSDFQKEGTLTGQLRQVITTKSYYPAKQAVNELTNSMFDNSDFGFQEQEFESVEQRVAFINVPLGTTDAQLQKILDDVIVRNAEIKAEIKKANVSNVHQLPDHVKSELKTKWKLSDTKFAKLQLSDPCVYKILSSHPVITSSQQYAIDQGLLQKNTLANRQVARYGENADNAGQLVLDQNAKPQFRQTFFSEFHVEDLDWRTVDPEDYFSTPEISLELTGVIEDSMEVQTSPDSAGQTA